MLDAFFEGMQRLESTVSYPAHGLQRLFAVFHQTVVRPRNTQVREVLCEPANGGRITAPIIVDDDDHIAVFPRCDIVERFPAHSTSQCTIAHHGHDIMLAAPIQREAF